MVHSKLFCYTQMTFNNLISEQSEDIKALFATIKGIIQQLKKLLNLQGALHTFLFSALNVLKYFNSLSIL